MTKCNTTYNIDDLIAKIDDTVCAVMFEFVQGEGGIIPLNEGFVNAIFAECENKDIRRTYNI